MGRELVVDIVVPEQPVSERVNAVVVTRALKYGALSPALAKRLAKKRLLVGDWQCRSGVLLNVPNALPVAVIAWKTVNGAVRRVFYVSEKGKGKGKEMGYLYVCLDDLLKATPMANPWKSRGRRRLEALLPLVYAFSLLVSKMVKTSKPVVIERRNKLAASITGAVVEAVKKWLSEVEAGEPSGGNPSGAKEA